MGDMKETEFGLEEIKDLKKTLTTWLREEINCGKDNVRNCDIDTLANAVHHLAETERNCYEALYYRTVTAQMEAAESSLRMGASRSRDSMGRYTSRGYTTYPYDQMDYVDAYVHDPNQFIDDMMPMGYRSGNRGGMNSGSMSNRSGNNSKSGNYGYHPMETEWDRYRMAKRHYTESGDSESKREMNSHAMNHFKDSIGTFKDIWEDADPTLKMEMKKDLQNLVADMPVN